jgi:hypothetical protein
MPRIQVRDKQQTQFANPVQYAVNDVSPPWTGIISECGPNVKVLLPLPLFASRQIRGRNPQPIQNMHETKLMSANGSPFSFE